MLKRKRGREGRNICYFRIPTVRMCDIFIRSYLNPVCCYSMSISNAGLCTAKQNSKSNVTFHFNQQHLQCLLIGLASSPIMFGSPISLISWSEQPNSEVKPWKGYLGCTERRSVELHGARRDGETVREVGVITAGAQEVKDDDHVKGEDRDWQVPAVQYWRETTEEEDTMGGGKENKSSDMIMTGEETMFQTWVSVSNSSFKLWLGS